MDPLPDLTSLQKHKQRLLLECEVNRQRLVLETDMLRLRLAHWRTNLHSLPEAWKFLTPLGALFTGDSTRNKTARLLAAGALGLALVTRWRRHRRSADRPPKG